jgi:chromosome segregation ATPase
MSDFSDPINQLKGDLEDLRMDIDLKEKDLKKVMDNLKESERQKELLEDEIDELREQEIRAAKEIEKIELDS